MTIVADTGPLYAALDRSDSWHESVAASMAGIREPLIVPLPVLVEVCQLLAARTSARDEARFLRACANGEVQVEPLTDQDLERAADLVERYADARIGFVDASVVAIAERLRVKRLLTIDRRHFSIIRPLHCPAFDFLP